MKLIAHSTCIGAWLKAGQFLLQNVGPDCALHHLILEVTTPTALADGDARVYDIVDRFLMGHGVKPLGTVANTIFPRKLYEHFGSAGIYEEYPKMYDKQIRTHPQRGEPWGSYAMRMLHRERDGVQICPLKELVDKMRGWGVRSPTNSKVVKAVYELATIDPLLDMPVYDPMKDRRRRRGGPCLSHVSFTIRPDNALNLTAMYRSHHYVQRTLGNLLGLAALQDFVATETGLEVGSLVCVSTLAKLDVCKGHYGRKDVRGLFKDCGEAIGDLVDSDQ